MDSLFSHNRRGETDYQTTQFFFLVTKVTWCCYSGRQKIFQI